MQVHAAAERILASVQHPHKELSCGIRAPDRSQFADQDVTRRSELQLALEAERGAKQKTLRGANDALKTCKPAKISAGLTSKQSVFIPLVWGELVLEFLLNTLVWGDSKDWRSHRDKVRRLLF